MSRPATAVATPAAKQGGYFITTVKEWTDLFRVYCVVVTRPWRRVCALAWPLAGADLLAFSKELIITSYVGHMGADHLSAFVLGQAVYNISGAAPLLWHYCCDSFLQERPDTDAYIAAAAAQFTGALAPALFLDAADQCCRRYLGAQSVVKPALWITALATLVTPLYLHLFCKQLGWGLMGAAAAWNATQGTSLLLMVGWCCRHTWTEKESRSTWPGWTVKAMRGWGTYMRVAVPSCIMLCCEWWAIEVVVLLAGLLPNPHLSMSVMGITINLHAFAFLAAQGLGGAASTCVAQDLGAGQPQQAIRKTKVAVILGTVLMCTCSTLLLVFSSHIGKAFSADPAVVRLTTATVLPLAISLIGEGANTVLAGVMRGCGRQQLGAAVSLVTYWAMGLPLAYALAFKWKMGAVGLWVGLTGTAGVQALLNCIIICRMDWAAEASRARALVATGELVLDAEHDLELVPKNSDPIELDADAVVDLPPDVACAPDVVCIHEKRPLMAC